MSDLRPRAGRSLVSSVLTKAACLVLFLSVPACVSTAPSLSPRAIELPRTVTTASILTPPTLDPEVELEALRHARSSPALLRRSFLELQCRRPQAAIDAAAEVLYAPNKPSPNEEAYARYLRAEGYLQMGKGERGRYDLDRARELALDAELQRRIEAISRRPDPTTPAAVLAMQSRSAWSASGENRTKLDPMGSPRRLTIHHSAVYFRDTRAQACAAQIQRIQRFHMGNRGYGDIGYHFLIDPAGRVWQGRELRWQGAHADGANNQQNIGICVLGNFLRGREGQGPNAAQLTTMTVLVRQLMRQFSFGADAIYCHSDFKSTDCPGPLMESAVAQMVQDLRTGRGAGHVAAAVAGP